MQLYQDRPSGTVNRARQLRRDAPEPERRLLRALREAHPHLKWRHQAPVGPFYADILCLSEKLVIEVDGDTHADSASDAARAAFVARAGFRTLRFTNADFMQNPDGVIEQMSFSLREKEGAAKRRKDEGGDPQKRGAAA